jgi:ADP-ribose pyrophosphatase
MIKTVYEGRFIRLMDDDGWEFADRVTGAGVICIVAIDDRHVVLVEEYRRTQQAPVISWPAGLIDRASEGEAQETAIEAALRELREETGYTARSIEEVASGPISPGMTTERVTFFIAQDLIPGPQMLDGGEDIKVHRVPLQHLSAFLGACSARGIEVDHKVFVGLYFAQLRGLTAGPMPWWRGWRARVAAMQRDKLQGSDGSGKQRHLGPRAARPVADDTLARLGKVLNWLGLTVGFLSGLWVAFCVATLFGAFGTYTDTFGMALLALGGAVVGLAGWLSGRAALYVLAGR